MDFELDFELVRKLAVRRREYLKEQEKKLREKTQEKAELQKKSHQEIYSQQALSDLKLREFGVNLDQEYANIHVTTFEETLRTNGFNYWQPQFSLGRYDPKPRERKEKKLEGTPGQNLKNTYYQCLELLQKYNFEIYHIEKILQNYKNRSWSACGGGTDTFIFYCRKGNYTFTAKFIDDCDCKPGLFRIGHVFHEPSQKSLDVQCDLYGQNVNSIHTTDFLALLESEDLEDYHQRRFGKVLRIPEELSNIGYEVTVSKDQLDGVHLNYHQYDYIFTVKTSKGNCILVPHTDYQKTEYVISVCEPFDEMIKKQTDRQYLPEELDVNSFNSIYSSFGREKKYCDYSPKNLSEMDSSQLGKCIETFMGWTAGEYGYFEEGTWHNEKELLQLVKNAKWTNFDVYTGPEINVEIFISFGRYKALPFEYYRLSFYFNSHESSKCKLRIEGKYNDQDKANDICDFTKEGSYLELYNEIKDFMAKLTQRLRNISKSQQETLFEDEF